MNRCVFGHRLKHSHRTFLLTVLLLAASVQVHGEEANPIDALFANQPTPVPSGSAEEEELMEQLLYHVGKGVFPGHGTWSPGDLARWSKINAVLDSRITAWVAPTEIVSQAIAVSLRGPDPLGDEARTLRRALLTRAVRSLGEPVVGKDEGQRSRAVHLRWLALAQALHLNDESWHQSQHWFILADRFSARDLIPAILAELERSMAEDHPPVLENQRMEILMWCAASAPPELRPRFEALLSKITYPVQRLRLLAALPQREGNERKREFLGTIDASMLNNEVRFADMPWDAELADALIQRLLLRSGSAAMWGEQIKRLSLSPETCARMIAAGLTAIQQSSGPQPNPEAMWMILAGRQVSVRGCLSQQKRGELQQAGEKATGVQALGLWTVRVCEEPDQALRVSLIENWLQKTVADKAMNSQLRSQLVATLVRALWLERAHVSAKTLAVLQTDEVRLGFHGESVERILTRHGIKRREAGWQKSKPLTLFDTIATKFDPLSTPAQVIARLASDPPPSEAEVDALAESLPVMVGAPWTAKVEQAFDRWWNNPSVVLDIHPANTAVAIGLWTAGCGLSERALAWAKRADLAALSEGRIYHESDGSLIYALAMPQHERTSIWREELRRIGARNQSFVQWIIDGHVHPLPHDLWGPTPAYDKILRQLVPKNEKGLVLIAPLLDVRTAFLGHGHEGSGEWEFFESRLNP